MFIWRLSEGDLSYSAANTGTRTHTGSFLHTLSDNHLSEEQKEEFVNIQTSLDSEGLVDRVFKVIRVNGDVVMAQGHPIEDGIVNTDAPLLYKVYENGNQIPCVGEELNSEYCDGDSFTDASYAETTFGNYRGGSSSEDQENTTHYIIGDYWYTADLVDEFDSVSTGIHRKNEGVALITQ